MDNKLNLYEGNITYPLELDEVFKVHPDYKRKAGVLL